MSEMDKHELDPDKILIGKVRALFNEVTPASRYSLIKKFIGYKVYQTPALNEVISIIFDHIIKSPDFCDLFLEVCSIQVNEEIRATGGPVSHFQNRLLEYAQEWFESLPKQKVSNDTEMDENKREERQKNLRMMKVGIVKFIGHLHQHGIASDSFVLNCSNQLLRSIDCNNNCLNKTDEQSVSLALQLIKVIGESLQEENLAGAAAGLPAALSLDEPFKKLHEAKSLVSGKLRSIILDLMDANGFYATADKLEEWKKKCQHLANLVHVRDEEYMEVEKILANEVEEKSKLREKSAVEIRRLEDDKGKLKKELDEADQKVNELERRKQYYVDSFCKKEVECIEVEKKLNEEIKKNSVLSKKLANHNLLIEEMRQLKKELDDTKKELNQKEAGLQRWFDYTKTKKNKLRASEVECAEVKKKLEEEIRKNLEENIRKSMSGMLVDQNRLSNVGRYFERQMKPSLRKIAALGYHFKNGKLRTIQDNSGFTFTTQEAYEELGDVIGEHVYELMEETGLERRYIDVGRNRRFFFTSPDYTEKERILVLINGTGVAKAGQWSRRLIINGSLSRGTQLDYIKRGLDNDWGVVVLNHNETCVGQKEKCHSTDAHALTEWKHAFLDVPAEADVVVVAHSYGGSIISEVVKRLHRAGDERVLCVSLTNGSFSEGEDVFAVNWHTQEKPLHLSGATWQIYSGDDTAEGTSAACIDSCFNILENIPRAAGGERADHRGES